MECMGSTFIVELRGVLVSELVQMYSMAELEELRALNGRPQQQLIYLLRHRSSVCVIAQFAYDVQEGLSSVSI
jgi:hypothetical protein